MDWHGFVMSYGVWGLGAGAFASATLLPLSSEALMLGGIAAGVPVGAAFAASCVGNCLGCVLNYILGAWLRERIHRRLAQTKSGRLAMSWIERHGTKSLWGSWLPFVGDPLTFLAGTIGVHWTLFAGIVFALRVARYAATLWGGNVMMHFW
jgi:membrane protein YqaA with SNARE-associated domain